MARTVIHSAPADHAPACLVEETLWITVRQLTLLRSQPKRPVM